MEDIYEVSIEVSKNTVSIPDIIVYMGKGLFKFKIGWVS